MSQSNGNGQPKTAGKQFVFTFKHLAEALVKQADIHEGIWRVAIKFGDICALNGNIQGKTYPAALVPVVQVILMRESVEVGESDLSVNAAVINPSKLIVKAGIHPAFQ